MRRLPLHLLVCLYVAVAALPGLGLLVRLPDVTTRGELDPIEPPRWRWAALLDESLQHATGPWVERTLAFRGVASHIDNSLLVHAFAETRPGVHVKVGRDRTLFSSDDLDYYSARRDLSGVDAEAEEVIARLAALQRRLASRGQALVPVVIPSKTSIYPAEIPPAWIQPLDEHPPDRIYGAMRRTLDAHQVRYVDARAMLTAPSTNRAEVWAIQGRHWTDYGACLALRAVVDVAQALRGATRLDYPCIAVPTPLGVRHTDFDLLRLLNAWGVAPVTTTVPRIVGLAPAAAWPVRHPRLLLVGSSFTSQLALDALRSGLFASIEHFYYNRTAGRLPDGEGQTIDIRTDEWRRTVTTSDVILVDLFETYFCRNNYTDEFVVQLGAALDAMEAASGPRSP